MEVTRSSRHNTTNVIAPRSTSKKYQTFQPINSMAKKEEVQNVNIIDISKHERAKFIRETNPTKASFKKLIYAKKKFLLLDLDQTLIHSVFTSQKTDVAFNIKGDQFKFNVRPDCFQFLERMSQIYTIYVFTASTADYAEPIVEYLNEKCKTIHGVLNRKNCMQTHNGFFIKDLRIIKNRGLKDMIIIDNLVHSFGLQIDNDLPILEYLKGKQDCELLGIEKILRQLAKLDDVRDGIGDKLNIGKILDLEEEDFVMVDEKRRHKTVKV